MNNFEQIMIRVGVNASAVTSGLQRVGSFVKSWATGIANDLKHHTLGRFLGLAALERGFDIIKEKIFAIRRAASDSGFSTNFVQSVFKLKSMEGESYEEVIKPLQALSAQAGMEGKTGKQLLEELYAGWHKLNTVEERNAYLKNLGIKGWQSLVPIMEQTRAQFDAMEKGNFFTKFSPTAISEITGVWNGLKTEGGILLNVAGNVLGTALKVAGIPWRILGGFAGGGFRGAWGEIKSNGEETEAERQIERKEWMNQLGKDDLTNEERITQELDKQKKLEEDILHLNERIGDRTKLTVGQLADRARQIMGDKMPRGLASIYSLTPAMASALQIQNLEDQAQMATAYGNDGLATQLQSRADQMRASNGALKSGERWPIKEITENIDHMQKNLDIMRKKLDRIPMPP